MDRSLKGTAVLLSCSIPEEIEGRFASQANFSFLTFLAREILRADGLIVSGGDPSVVPLLQTATITRKAGVAYQREAFRGSSADGRYCFSSARATRASAATRRRRTGTRSATTSPPTSST